MAPPPLTPEPQPPMRLGSAADPPRLGGQSSETVLQVLFVLRVLQVLPRPKDMKDLKDPNDLKDGASHRGGGHRLLAQPPIPQASAADPLRLSG